MTHAASTPGHPPVVRLPSSGALGGVCEGIGRYLGVAPTWLRVLVVLVAAWRLTGVVAYFLVWLILPLPVERTLTPGLDAHRRAGLRPAAAPDARQRPPWWERLGLGVLGVGAVSVVQAVGWGLPPSWFLVGLLGASGLAAIWWHADRATTRDIRASDGPLSWLAPLASRSTTLLGVGLGVLLLGASVVLAATLLPVGAIGRALLGIGLALLALGAAVAPWLLRVRRTMAHAREAKLVSDARADMAAHLHDSVLQTLALIQKQAGDPREVTRLARRQERELRAWLYAGDPTTGSLTAALEAAAQEVEDAFPVDVEVVGVGDAEVDGRLLELVRAAREAMTNAAKHSGVQRIDVYAEALGDAVEVHVRDRGRGFHPDAVPEGRLGVRKSIMERMARHGGTVTIRSHPDTGTDVTLEMNR